MKTSWYENSSRFIPVHWQPAALFEFGLQRNIDQHRLLKSTGLFPQDFREAVKKVSPIQVMQLFKNSLQLHNEKSFPFLFGDRLLPGSCSEFTHGLSHTTNLFHTLELLNEFPLLAFPLLKCKKIQEENKSGLEWVDIFGLGDLQQHCLEAAVTSVVAWVKWQSKMQMPWQFEFNFAKPKYFEEYEVHLGDNCQPQKYAFNTIRCRLMVDDQYLFRPWPKGSDTLFSIAFKTLQQTKSLEIQEGFCGAVKSRLVEQLNSDVSLEQIAETFNMSSSSLKRKLKQHHSSFQQLLDSCRAEKAVALMSRGNLTFEQIAEQLQIKDSSNFRRSFKRWTGLSPKDYRDHLCCS